MGRTMRRVTEAVLQKLQLLHVPLDSSFERTSNARNEAMFKEATAFSVHIRTMERDLRAMERQLAGQFCTLRDIMITPLPKVYDWSGPNDEQQPVVALENPSIPSHLYTIGRHVDYDRLARAVSSMAEALEDQVYKPMGEWQGEYKKVQTQMKLLEALRLELDSRKRTVAQLTRKLGDQMDKNHREGSAATSLPPRRIGSAHLGSGGGGRLEGDIEKTTQRKAKKEESKREASNEFDQLEQVTFTRLETLIMDASSLREYAATSLYHLRECFASALSSFETAPGDAAQQLPRWALPESTAAQEPMPMPAGSDHQSVGQPKPRSTSGLHPAYRPSTQDLIHTQYDQEGFDAVPLGKAVPSVPVADVAPRYIQHAPIAPAQSNTPSRRLRHAGL